MAKQVYLDPNTGEPQDPGAAPAAPLLSSPFLPKTTDDPGNPASDPSTPGPQPAPLPPAAPSAPVAPVPTAPITTQPVIPPIPAGSRLVDPGPGPVSGSAPGTDPGRTGDLNDPAYRDALIAYWGAQPGANPSVAGDPNYWRGAAPRFNGDVNYFIQRMLTPEGAPEGGGSPTGGSGGAGANTLDPNIADFFAAQTAALRAQQQRDAQIREIIMQRLALAGQPVDENSAEITQPLSAARNEAQRSQDAERTALAERLYAQGGLNTNALGQQIQASSERNAGSLGDLRAGLISHVADAKRQELESLLQMATAQGDSASARAVQAQIAALNASVASQGQSISLAEFLASLNQNAALAGLNG